MKVSVIKDAVDCFQVVVQLSDNPRSGRLALSPRLAMDLAADLIRASLDARFRNANANVAPDDDVVSA